MKIRAALLLKAPILGTVKTRLAASIGNDRALQIYLQLVQWQLSQIPAHWEIDIHFSPNTEIQKMKSWLSPLTSKTISYFPQPEGDLGVRLLAALTNSLAQGTDRVALMGGDCPDLTIDYLREAGERSASVNVTIAPTLDGGYALMILDRLYPPLFQKIHWSTSTVFAETTQSVESLKLTLYELKPVEDIDDLESLQRSRFAQENR